MYFDDLCLDRRQTVSIILILVKRSSVLHTQLLLKLRSAGIIGSVWSWLQSYLSGRTACLG